jgi:hypothetical protein
MGRRLRARSLLSSSVRGCPPLRPCSPLRGCARAAPPRRPCSAFGLRAATGGERIPIRILRAQPRPRAVGGCFCRADA